MNENETKYALWLWNVPGITNAKIRKITQALTNSNKENNGDNDNHPYSKEEGVSSSIDKQDSREDQSGQCRKESSSGSDFSRDNRNLIAAQVYTMSEEEIHARIPELAEADVQSIVDSRDHYNVDAEWLSLLEKGISFVCIEQEDYPKRLRNITNPPYGLYYKGNLPASDGIAVGIVGARGRSEYGRQVARKIAKSLAQNGIDVISGLARGIDADGHIGALDGGGRTYAVLGCGVDLCYPNCNQYLYDRILDEGGGIFSEYHPGTQPIGGQFPQRNRIISGLSDSLIVVEARKRSGSLITADFAMEQGRDVFAVPGRAGDALSEGTNNLIHQGAGIYVDTESLLRDLHLDTQISFDFDFHSQKMGADECAVYSILDFTPCGLGTLLEQCALPLTKLITILASLEDKGYIRENVPNYYVRCV